MPFSTDSAVVSAADLFNELNNPSIQILVTSMCDPASGEPEQDPEGYIPGALHFDFESDFCDTENPLPHSMPATEQFEQRARALGLSNEQLIVVYDNKGIYSAPRVWWMLKAMGHKNVWVLDGGLPGWLESGLPLSKEQKSNRSTGNFKAEFDERLICNWEYVLEASTNKSGHIMDARAAQRFYGLVAEPRKGLRSGHMPNAKSLPFTELLSEGRYLREKSVLKGLFSQSVDEQLVFSCGSGVTACILALGAYQCGYHNLSVYDGSWSEWGSRKDLPVVTD